MKVENIDELKRISNNVRKNIIEEVYNARSGHPGGSLSIADIVTVLYFNEMDQDSQEKNKKDKLVLSKGHAVAALYAVLAEKGVISKEELVTFRKVGSRLQGHPDMEKIEEVDMSTGSLGQGLSIANGMAIAAKLDNLDTRVYCILGDGEIEEGQVWEAAMTAHKYKLNNLCAILDYNNLQIDGTIEEVKGLEKLEEKWEAFGFNVIKLDGNDIEELIKGFKEARNYKEGPSILVAKTVKGKGVSFMENKAEWHGKAPSEDEYRLAMQELNLLK